VAWRSAFRSGRALTGPSTSSPTISGPFERPGRGRIKLLGDANPRPPRASSDGTPPRVPSEELVRMMVDGRRPRRLSLASSRRDRFPEGHRPRDRTAADGRCCHSRPTYGWVSGRRACLAHLRAARPVSHQVIVGRQRHRPDGHSGNHVGAPTFPGRHAQSPREESGLRCGLQPSVSPAASRRASSCLLNNGRRTPTTAVFSSTRSHHFLDGPPADRKRRQPLLGTAQGGEESSTGVGAGPPMQRWRDSPRPAGNCR